MKGARIGLLFALCIILSITYAAVYEARNSDDVDFFLAHNPEENGALMFFDPKKEEDTKVSKIVDKVLSVFKNIGEEGRSTEAWVNALNDKVHLMRVDATNDDNLRTVDEYMISETPLLVLLDNGSIELMEVLSDKTADHVKDFYQNKLAEKKAAQKASSSDTDKAIESAMQAASDAKKAASDAQKALDEARKAFEDHMKEHKANETKADDKKAGSQGNDSCPSGNNQNQQGNQQNGQQGNQQNNQQQNGQQNNQQQNGQQQNGQQQNGQQQNGQQQNGQQQNGQQQQYGQQQNQQQGGQPQGQYQAPAGYKLDYVPVYRKIDETPAKAPTPAPVAAPTRYVNHDGHWHIVS